MMEFATLKVRAKDLHALALMLRLHSHEADVQAGECLKHDPCGKPYRSWRRASRKAHSFAVQFEEAARDLLNGQPSNHKII